MWFTSPNIMRLGAGGMCGGNGGGNGHSRAIRSRLFIGDRGLFDSDLSNRLRYSDQRTVSTESRSTRMPIASPF